MSYLVIPIVNIGNECNISDDVLLSIWGKMVGEDKEKCVFYDGTVAKPWQWLMFIKRTDNYPIIVIDEKGPVCIAWLNCYENKSARAHHCVFGPYRRGIGQAVLDYWKGLKGVNGDPLLLTIIGITPETNIKACKALKILGFTVLGTVPNLCRMKYDEDKLVGGVVSYYCPQGG